MMHKLQTEYRQNAQVMGIPLKTGYADLAETLQDITEPTAREEAMSKFVAQRLKDRGYDR